jgi:hypothetical protein
MGPGCRIESGMTQKFVYKILLTKFLSTELSEEAKIKRRLFMPKSQLRVYDLEENEVLFASELLHAFKIALQEHFKNPLLVKFAYPVKLCGEVVERMALIEVGMGVNYREETPENSRPLIFIFKHEYEFKNVAESGFEICYFEGVAFNKAMNQCIKNVMARFKESIAFPFKEYIFGGQGD